MPSPRLRSNCAARTTRRANRLHKSPTQTCNPPPLPAAVRSIAAKIACAEKLHFVSRLKQITLSSPTRKNIPLSFYQKL
jgi:hypothetical protein